MSDRGRLVALTLLLGAGGALAAVIAVHRIRTPLPASLAPAFQLFGTPVKAIDHVLTRVIPIDALDERDFGTVLRARYDLQAAAEDPDFVYVNDLLSHLARTAAKPLEYRAYVLDHPDPNAMALPGGVVLVTTGLLRTLRSEAELASVLGHELGHIERGHCLDAVRFQLLADKVGGAALGEIVDFAVRLLVSHSFSKTQEDDADEYAYALLEQGPYDPRGVGAAFASLLAYVRAREVPARTGVDPLRDYFSSHPPLEVREAKFRARADAWWRRHGDARREVGERNLRDRVSVFQRGSGPRDMLRHEGDPVRPDRQ